ncbi:hypothetical protein BDQ17DRAFT_1253858, partial [Cyathus striatus]
KVKGKQRAETAHPRLFTLTTYKLHCLADYPKAIHAYGTTDMLSTQIVIGNPSISFEEGDDLPPGSPEKHYQMSNDICHPIPIANYLHEHQNDLTMKEFLPHLKDHLLARILNQEYDGDETPFSKEERAKLKFHKHEIYQHKVLRVNYTTYDMRQEQDSMNPRTHANIMVVAHDEFEGHPYWYARIIGVFHALIIHSNYQDPVRMDFLWVRWYGLDSNPRYKSGWKAQHLPRIGFIEEDDDNLAAFGFLDPTHVVQGVHLIPTFKEGQTHELLKPSLARLPKENDLDYLFYYVNM